MTTKSSHVEEYPFAAQALAATASSSALGAVKILAGSANTRDALAALAAMADLTERTERCLLACRNANASGSPDIAALECSQALVLMDRIAVAADDARKLAHDSHAHHQTDIGKIVPDAI